MLPPFLVLGRLKHFNSLTGRREFVGVPSLPRFQAAQENNHIEELPSEMKLHQTVKSGQQMLLSSLDFSWYD